jgi:hypothetical protein
LDDQKTCECAFEPELEEWFRHRLHAPDYRTL